MRTIAVDDEPWMLKRFAIECESIPDIQLMGCFRNPLKALEFARENRVELAFMDIEMPEMTGLQLAEKLREIVPELIIIFVSAYEQYMTEAFKSKIADYYIMKPYNTGDLLAAVDRARLLSGRLRKQILVRTFGAFELFVENTPVAFPDSETKELLALLIDKRGGALTAEEAHDTLWPSLPPEESAIKFRYVLKRLQEALQTARLDGIVEQNREGAFVRTDIMDCDLFQFLDGNPKTMRQFSGEYMAGYAWAENTRRHLLLQNTLLCRYSDAQIRNSLCASIRCINDPAVTLTHMNEAFLDLVGYTREEIDQHFHNSLRAMIVHEDLAGALDKGIQPPHATAPIAAECRLVSKNNDEIWVLIKSEAPQPLSGDVDELDCIVIDISALKTEQNILKQTAQHDSLTGLYNRGTAQEQIRQYLQTPETAHAGALILMDVDNFKSVNDTYGHPFADTVLTDIAAILTRAFRQSDILCRLGGDEMMIFLKDVQDEADAREKLKKATDTLAERLHAKTERGEISCSFGGVHCPTDGSDFELLYQHADRALYAAKKKKACTVWFSDIRTHATDKPIG